MPIDLLLLAPLLLVALLSSLCARNRPNHRRVHPRITTDRSLYE